MTLEPYDTLDCDVLVIGAGGAGMRAAIAAAEAGCSVAVVTKSLLGKAHTVMAEGGIAAGLANVDARDSWEVHFADTMLGGQLLNNWRMVELYAHEVIDRVYELERWGGLFDRTDDGRIMQRAFGAHSWKRLCHVGDRTGLELIRTLQDKLVHTPRAEVHMEYALTSLIKSGDGVCGAMGYRRSDGRFVAFRCGAVVLASGGWGRMYRETSNSWEGTGDGAAMAYEAGAELLDMELGQFHPSGSVWSSVPPSTTRWAASAWKQKPVRPPSRGSTPGVRWPVGCTGRIASVAIRWATSSCSASAQVRRPPSTRGHAARNGTSTNVWLPPSRRRCCGPWTGRMTAPARARTHTSCTRNSRPPCRTTRASAGARSHCSARWPRSSSCASEACACTSAVGVRSIPAGTHAETSPTC